MKNNEYLITKEVLLSETGGDRATGYAMSNKILRIRDKLLCTWLDCSRFNHWAIVDLATAMGYMLFTNATLPAGSTVSSDKIPQNTRTANSDTVLLADRVSFSASGVWTVNHGRSHTFAPPDGGNILCADGRGIWKPWSKYDTVFMTTNIGGHTVFAW